MDLKQLKEQFDEVFIWYVKDPNTKERTGTTIAVLHKGTERFIGISKTHGSDSFNKKIGRKIALNRAFAATNRYVNYSYTTDARDEAIELPKYSEHSEERNIWVPAWMLRKRKLKNN